MRLVVYWLWRLKSTPEKLKGEGEAAFIPDFNISMTQIGEGFRILLTNTYKIHII
jgi:hypothetical protein